MDNSLHPNHVPDLMDTLTQRYVSPAYAADHQMLDQAQTWTLMKSISALVQVLVQGNRSDTICDTSWRGLTMPPDEFVTKLTNVGANTLPNLGEIGQNPTYIAKLHTLYLEKTTNSMGLLRLVDTAMNDQQDDDGKKLKGIGRFMAKEDPVLAMEALCTKVVPICTYISTKRSWL